MLKDNKLCRIACVKGGSTQNISITTELIAKGIVSQIANFMDPGDGSIENAINIAPELPHFPELVDLLNSKWSDNGISDLLDDPMLTLKLAVIR